MKQLIEEKNIKSPLIRLKNLFEEKNLLGKSRIRHELKLFGNIFKGSIRDQIRKIFHIIKKQQDDSSPDPDIKNEIVKLCTETENVRDFYLNLQSDFFYRTTQTNTLRNHLRYVDEFTSNIVEHYFTALLKIIRTLSYPDLAENDANICRLILKEQDHRNAFQLKSQAPKADDTHESILYRESLLNKYILEALHLEINRLSFEEKYGDIVGSVAAGIAMFVYLVLFTWKSPSFVIDSLPFIFLGVVLYILKDRLKEGLKRLYVKQAFRWFPDYSTDVRNRNGQKVGKINENFSFIKEKDVPEEILKMRNKEFNEELPSLKRSETIINYKREVILYKETPLSEKRRQALTTLFRFNIHRFLEKANNSIQSDAKLNAELDIIERFLPKVYHLNIIILNSPVKSDSPFETKIKKFRVIIDKFGIKRVEQL